MIQNPSNPTKSQPEATASRQQSAQDILTDQTNLLPFKQVIAVFSGLALCIIVAALDGVVVATALPSISSAFNAGSVVSWVPSAYLLTSTCFQPLYGRFSDIFGRKPTFVLALTIFILGNLVAGFSKTIIQLIILRGFAGAGGGGIVSMVQIIISDIVSLRDRGKYQGIITGSVAVGYLIGPVAGGALSEKVSWKWCFWIDIPIAFIAMCVIIFLLPLKPVRGSMRKKLMIVDYLGTCLMLTGCALVLLPLIWGGVTFPWISATVLAPLFSGILVLLLFCGWEWKGAQLPIVPMYIFRHLTVSGVCIAMFIDGFIFFNTLYYLPQFYQVALRYSPIRASIFLIPLLVSQMVFSGLTGIVVSRTGRYRSIIYAGFAVWAIACGCQSTVTNKANKSTLVMFMLLAGTGAGMIHQTTTVAAQASVPRKDMSVVTAFRNFVRLLGGALSLAVASTIINNSMTNSMNHLNIPSSTIRAIIDDPALLSSNGGGRLSSFDTTYILSSGYIGGFRSVFILNACLATVATIVSFLMIKHNDLSREEEGDEKGILTTGTHRGKLCNGAEEAMSRPVSQTSADHDIEIGAADDSRKQGTEGDYKSGHANKPRLREDE